VEHDRVDAGSLDDGEQPEQHYDVELATEWSSLVGVHGGYMCALAAKAASAAVPGRDVRTLTTSFLRTGRTGSARLSARRMRHGRSMSTVLADLVQNGRIVTTTRVTLTGQSSGVEWNSPVSLDLPALEDCVPVAPPPGIGHFDRVDALIDPSNLPFTGGDRARVSGYFRPLEARPIDAAWLAMAVDWFPPPAFVRTDPPTGGVSIDLTMHVHRTRQPLDGDEWLIAAFEVANSSGGLAVEHGVIAEFDGTLLAESFQTRWTAQTGT
jgi:acyl-CoA thioesterase